MHENVVLDALTTRDDSRSTLRAVNAGLNEEETQRKVHLYTRYKALLSSSVCTLKELINIHTLSIR